MEDDTIEKIRGYLKKEFELDEEDISEVLNEFLSNMQSLIKKASSEIAARNWTDLKKTAHSIKGVSANLGADFISSRGKELENAALASDDAKVSSLISEISNSFENLKNRHI
ncbi:MAG: Hpt domain-containing protein [Victivallales bacterium]